MKKALKFMIYNLVVAVLLLVGIECYLNHLLNHPKKCPKWLTLSLKAYSHQQDWKIVQYQSDMAQYDSALFYRLKPGITRFDNREFKTEMRINSAGFRDDEGDQNFPKVIVTGDSYAMGWGVDHGKDFASLLEQKTGRKNLNMGVSSYGTAREMKALSFVNTDSLEWLIIQYCPNDHNENVATLKNGGKVPVSSDSIYQKACENHLKTIRYYPGKHLIKSTSYLKLSKQKNTGFRKEDKNNMKLEEAFYQVLKKINTIPAHTQILVFSLEAERSNNSFINALQSRLDEDFASSLHDRIHLLGFNNKIKSKHRFIFDPHLNENGHYLVADHLDNFMDTVQLYSGRKVWNYPGSDQVSIKANYQNGLKHGTTTYFWEHGEVSQISEYKRGKKVGIEYRYDQSGEEISSTKY